MDYWILTSQAKGAGIIDAYPLRSPPGWQFDEGMSLAKAFPKNAWMRLSKNYPDNRLLVDFQPNILNSVIVSPAARAVVDSFEPDNVEYLPVDVRDHRNKVAGKGHAILNPLGSVPAIDMKRSKLVMGKIIKDQIHSVDELRLDRKAIPKEAVIFRCATWLRLILVRDDLKKALEKAKLTGCRFFEADGWDGLDI